MPEVYVITNAGEVAKRIALDDKYLADAGKDIADDIGNRAFLDLIRTTGTWNHKVGWVRNKVVLGGEVIVSVDTDNDIYRYVDEGTRPHFIMRKNADFLKFHSGYTPKTTPGVLGSHAGGDFGKLVFREIVYHPGNEPRHFTRTVMDKYAVTGPQIAEKHIKEWKARA
jgi:hypothetical protein